MSRPKANSGVRICSPGLQGAMGNTAVARVSGCYGLWPLARASPSGAMNAKAIARLDLENGLHRVVESDELTRRSGYAGLESAVEVRNIVATLSGSAN